MRSSTSALSLLAILSSFSPASATYNLKASYTAANLLSSFTFFTGSDPTHGDVQYVAQSVAQNAGLVGTTNNQVYLGVDYKTVNPPAGRQSVRLSSNTAWNKGIFAVDIAHMPAADCGVWPAFWMFGPNWPNSGEIDIIEGYVFYISIIPCGFYIKDAPLAVASRGATAVEAEYFFFKHV
jgi:hypothetical protein